MIAVLMLVATVTSPPVATCRDGMRGDPVVRIRAEGKNHWVYHLTHEVTYCHQLADKWNENKIDVLCGCKQLISPGEKDRVRLRCAHRMDNDKVASHTVAIYYYYPDSVPACKRLRNILMKKKKGY